MTFSVIAGEHEKITAHNIFRAWWITHRRITAKKEKKASKKIKL